MTLRKITVDNSVRYVPKSEKTKETDLKPKKRKAGSLPRKQDKNFQKIIKNLLKILQQADLEYLQNSMYMYKNNYVIIRI